MLGPAICGVANVASQKFRLSVISGRPSVLLVLQPFAVFVRDSRSHLENPIMFCSGARVSLLLKGNTRPDIMCGIVLTSLKPRAYVRVSLI